jgi:hypothetical protein
MVYLQLVSKTSNSARLNATTTCGHCHLHDSQNSRICLHSTKSVDRHVPPVVEHRLVQFPAPDVVRLWVADELVHSLTSAFYIWPDSSGIVSTLAAGRCTSGMFGTSSWECARRRSKRPQCRLWRRAPRQPVPLARGRLRRISAASSRCPCQTLALFRLYFALCRQAFEQ